MPYLDPYAGTWTATQARHLLRRTTFGPSHNMVTQAVNLGLAGTLSELFTVLPIPVPPVKFIPDGTGSQAINDPAATYGNTWVNGDPFPNVNPPMLRNRVLRGRSKSLYAWTFHQMHYSGINIVDKMTLFWHNHFVVADGVIPHREYLYQILLRTHALGNFRQLTKDITIDTGMLIYLSGTENTNTAPNENYSRELLELFTVGKGDLIAPGDYSNYTESDVIEMAKVLTGWQTLPVTNANTLMASFSNNRHTTGSKNLSYHFNNAVILENGDEEYKDLIDVIFQNSACASFISRKLYRWFVNAEITPDIENNIIVPMAANIVSNDYEIAPALQLLLGSEHFFESVACMIKSPVDLILSVTRGLNIEPPTDSIEDEYEHSVGQWAMCTELEQSLYFHPNVAGWKAYYQNPSFYQLWINNLLLPKRHEYSTAMITGNTVSIDGDNYNIFETVDVLALAASVPNAELPNDLIEELGNRLFAYPISTSQRDALKMILIGTLPDFEWTVEYSNYPSNPMLQTSVENKLKTLLAEMVQMSEFQIM